MVSCVTAPAREAIQWEDKYFVLQDGWDKKYFPMEHYDGLRAAWKDLLIRKLIVRLIIWSSS